PPPTAAPTARSAPGTEDPAPTAATSRSANPATPSPDSNSCSTRRSTRLPRQSPEAAHARSAIARIGTVTVPGPSAPRCSCAPRRPHKQPRPHSPRQEQGHAADDARRAESPVESDPDEVGTEREAQEDASRGKPHEHA